MRRIPPPRPNKPAKPHPFFKVKSRDPAQLDAELIALFKQGRLAEAKAVGLDLLKLVPKGAKTWSDVGALCALLEQWDECIVYASKAVELDENILAAHDGLSHAHGALKQWDKARAPGMTALNKRNARFGRKKFDPAFVPARPRPFRPDPSRNVIAFSLFGANPKYCETAVLNASERAQVYPHWTCRFYVDNSVPADVQRRLQAHGAQVVQVTADQQRWPGPMWRMLAADDPIADRVIFRDADSLITAREAAAVAEWVDSGLPFHMMRDGYSHTELMLAGMWGCTRGSLPSMAAMVADYLKVEPESHHFADQYFLREYVWAYARDAVLQHDACFGFLNARPFPGDPADGTPQRSDVYGFHVGSNIATNYATFAADVPDGTPVTWQLEDLSANPPTLLCTYTTPAQGGLVKVFLPRQMIVRVNDDLRIRKVSPTDAPA